MRIQLTAVGTKMPAWINAGVKEYLKRMPPHCRVELKEVAAGYRGHGNGDIKRVIKAEGERLLAAVPPRFRIIALERRGKTLPTEDWAANLERWFQDGDEIAILVGGPEGLSSEVIVRSDELWSLSALTMAHPIVRVVVAEQLYRAFSIVDGKPYHRGSQP